MGSSEFFTKKYEMIDGNKVVDTNTGEVHTINVHLQRDRDTDPYVKVFCTLSEKVLEDIGTMNAECKLLLWMVSHTANVPMQSSGWIKVMQEKVAQKLGVSRVSLNKAIKNLERLGYIEHFGERSSEWRMVPELCYKGILKTFRKAGEPECMTVYVPSECV